MDYTKSGRLIKYRFSCKGVKESDRFFSPSVEKLYKKLFKAKQMVENARPTAEFERKFMLAMDRLDELLLDIEEHGIYSEEKIAREALRRKLLGLTNQRRER